MHRVAEGPIQNQGCNWVFHGSRVGERAGGSPGLQEEGANPWGRKKTGRGRNEPALATARPQEYVDSTYSNSVYGGPNGHKGDPPAWKPPVCIPSLAWGFPHPHLGNCTPHHLHHAGSTIHS